MVPGLVSPGLIQVTAGMVGIYISTERSSYRLDFYLFPSSIAPLFVASRVTSGYGLADGIICFTAMGSLWAEPAEWLSQFTWYPYVHETGDPRSTETPPGLPGICAVQWSYGFL